MKSFKDLKDNIKKMWLVSLIISIVIAIGSGIKFAATKTARAIRLAALSIYAVVMIVIDYIVAMHSSEASVSWSRWAATVVVASGVYFIRYGIKSQLLSGASLAAAIGSLFGLMTVVLAAGKIAGGGNSGDTIATSFGVADRFRGYVGLPQTPIQSAPDPMKKVE